MDCTDCSEPGQMARRSCQSCAAPMSFVKPTTLGGDRDAFLLRSAEQTDGDGRAAAPLISGRSSSPSSAAGFRRPSRAAGSA